MLGGLNRQQGLGFQIYAPFGLQVRFALDDSQYYS
jgi:hypothetical protein